MQVAYRSDHFPATDQPALRTVRGAHDDCALYPTQAHADDHQFVKMLDAYRDSGGLARADEVIALSRRVGGPEVASMARWIVERKVLSLEWQSDLWLPLFQFNRLDMTPQPETAQVVSELNPAFGPWDLAGWFARPHALLANRAPADVFAADFPAVLRAARAERADASP